jgi:hypothetical protein
MYGSSCVCIFKHFTFLHQIQIQVWFSLMRDWRFSQRCCWGFRSSGTWCCVAGSAVPDVSKNHSASTFMVKHSSMLENERTRIVSNVRNDSSSNTASRPRRLQSSEKLLRKHQISVLYNLTFILTQFKILFYYTHLRKSLHYTTLSFRRKCWRDSDVASMVAFSLVSHLTNCYERIWGNSKTPCSKFFYLIIYLHDNHVNSPD